MAMPRTDKYGFPIPPSFDDLTPTSTGPAAEPRRRGRSPRLWSGFLLLLGGAMVVSVALKSPLADGSREAVADWLRQRAEQLHHEGHTDAALAMLDRSLRWQPDDAAALLLRGKLRLGLRQVDPAVEDFDRLIELRPNFYPAYYHRCMAHHQRGEHHRAIDDMNRAVELTGGNDPEMLNGRAYARALANDELEAGLADIELALEMLERRAEFRTRESQSASRAAYLDTRGYLLHLLGQQQRALDDMNEAIEIAETEYAALQALRGTRRVDQRLLAQAMTQWEHHLAVMHHHRGLIHQQLDNHPQAKVDLQLAEQFGYNPAAGVY